MGSTVTITVPSDLAPFIQRVIDHVGAFRKSARESPDFAGSEKALMKLMGSLERASIGRPEGRSAALALSQRRGWTDCAAALENMAERAGL